MYRAQAFREAGGFDTQSGFALDVDLAMRIAARHDFYYIDQVLSSFRYTPISLTAAMHSGGSDVAVFYYITRKTLGDPAAMNLFPASEHRKLVRDSLFFCSCRALSLNGMAALRARDGKIILRTLRLIFREDPYWWNKSASPGSWRAKSAFPSCRRPNPSRANKEARRAPWNAASAPPRPARRAERPCVFSLASRT